MQKIWADGWVKKMTNIEEIIEIIKKEDRVIKVDIMDDECKKTITQLEMKRLEELVPLINRGLEETLKEEYALIVLKDKRDVFLEDEELIPTLTLMSENGTLIGEEIYDPEELEELREDPNVYFISEHFVTYPSLSTPGDKQYFVVNQLRGEMECEEKIEEIVSSLSIATPSTEADHYIKDLYDMDYVDGIITMVIGVTI